MCKVLFEICCTNAIVVVIIIKTLHCGNVCRTHVTVIRCQWVQGCCSSPLLWCYYLSPFEGLHALLFVMQVLEATNRNFCLALLLENKEQMCLSLPIDLSISAQLQLAVAEPAHKFPLARAQWFLNLLTTPHIRLALRVNRERWRMCRSESAYSWYSGCHRVTNAAIGGLVTYVWGRLPVSWVSEWLVSAHSAWEERRSVSVMAMKRINKVR